MRTTAVLLSAAAAVTVATGAPALPAAAADGDAPLSVSPTAAHRGDAVRVFLAGGAGGDAEGVDVSAAGPDWRGESPAFTAPAALAAYGKGATLSGETRIRCDIRPGTYTVTLKGTGIRTRTDRVRLTATLTVTPDAADTPSARCAAQADEESGGGSRGRWAAGIGLLAAASAAGAWAYVRRTRRRRATGA
ncbi:hypothetical protein ACWCQL_06630 [Streptomyces sp. NPDC002073]